MTPQETEEEKRRARELAKRVGGVLAMLLGVISTDTQITWNPAAGRFLVAGEYIAAEAMRQQLIRLNSRAGNEMAAEVERLLASKITIDEWRDSMHKQIGSVHVVAGALAAGSITAALASGKVQAQIASERVFADGFARDLKKKQKSGPSWRARARSYVQSTLVTFAAVELVVRQVLGYTEARRVLTAAESCDGCRHYGYQWLPLADMPEIGSLDCGSRCRCYLEYR
jgi:hypothetical protein